MEVNSYVQSIKSFREWSVGRNVPDEYQIVINADKRLKGKQATSYDESSASEVPAIVSGTEEGAVLKGY